MSKLTKPEIKAHQAACELLKKDRLNYDERWSVLRDWHEGATNINSAVGAFFTPLELARDFSVEVGKGRIIDLCAGIGALAWSCFDGLDGKTEVVCVESNPAYVEVGRKVLPEATWIEADVFALPDLGQFDWAIANPPFGATKRAGSAPRYKGKAFEYHLIDIASDLAKLGVFIIPQDSAPFRYSGHRRHEVVRSAEYERFAKATGIELEANCGIDTSYSQGAWRGVAPKTEIVIADFAEARQRRLSQEAPLFAAAAE